MTTSLLQMKNSIASNKSYDLTRWEAPIINHQEHDKANNTWDQDGIHRICTETGASIDIYMQDHCLLDQIKNDQERVLLVGFTGALTIRNGKPGPFFSGFKVAKQLKLPLLAVADPTISKCEDLIISWYAGNENVVNASEILGKWLDKLAHYYNARLVLFGGSAGGFGALSVLPYLTARADCLVWNPQTSIGQYMPKFVLHYLKHGFTGRFAGIDTKKSVTRDELRGFLNETGVRHDLQSNYRVPENVNLLFVQNKSDWHVKSHALPFLRNLNVFDDSDELVDRSRGNISVRVGNFGRGHIAPQKNIINACLAYLIDPAKNSLDSEIFQSAVQKTSKRSTNEISKIQITLGEEALVVEDDGFEVSATREGNAVIATIDVMPGLFIKPTFAFYFIRNGIREKIRPYAQDNTASFEFKGDLGSAQVMGFIFDNGSRKFKKTRVKATNDAKVDQNPATQSGSSLSSDCTFIQLLGESRNQFLSRNSPLLTEKFKALRKDWLDGDIGHMVLPYTKNGIAFKLGEQFDWSACPALPPQKMWFYSLRFVGRLLATGHKYSDERAYQYALKLMEDFLRFCSVPENVSYISSINSGDHSTAERVKVMIFLWQIIVEKNIETSEEFNRNLLRETERWAEWLACDRNYKANNHGLMGCMSLLYTYVFLGESLGQRYLEIASQRITNLMDQSFDSSGLCNENSIGYHNFNLSLYRSILNWLESHKFESQLVQKIRDTVKRATNALALCVFPNGDIPPIGDSSIYKSGVNSINRSHCFKESGFAVIKNDNFYLSISCGSPSEIHKQMDDSSIHLRYRGSDLIVDPGAYLYDRNDRFRKCIGSSKGHSGIYLKRFDVWSRRQVRAKFGEVSGEISKFEEFEGGIQIACSYRMAHSQFVLRRFICVVWDQDITIVDQVEGADDSVQRFIFGSSVEVGRRKGHFHLSVDGNIYKLFHGACKFDLYTAEDGDSNVRGWHSVNYGELRGTTGIDFTNPRKNFFSTILSLQNIGSRSACSPKSRSFAKMTGPFFDSSP